MYIITGVIFLLRNKSYDLYEYILLIFMIYDFLMQHIK